MTNSCFNCEEEGKEFFGYLICENCKSSIRLFTEKTIHGHYQKDPFNFTADIKTRLELLEKDYKKKRIKLLHILSVSESFNQ